ncbi:MAG: DUF1501 domain-containing protein [Alphaproteobacteria bacterium]|nr:DUF1501 domain-containing protein [Alphaproteobacteria bacterium]MDE2042549.1 DUF1501 domain-containing protein [Alphaproteobacteria bacterium]MDE2339698.1 DUF1501 domain-containing protein [Alphaproteobacteria bacterium]
MDRRSLLTSALGAGALTCSGRLMAAPATDQRLLVVFLRGAYDAANIVIPTYSDFYYQSRPSLAIARPNPNDPKAALPLDGQWSLHPALAQSIYPLWQAKQIAFVPYVGTDDMSRSHFETQDTIELGQPINASRDYRSGFMGRLAGALGGCRPIAFSNNVPIIFHDGSAIVPNLAIQSVGKPNFDARQQAIIEAMYRNPAAQRLAPAVSVQEGFQVREQAFTSLQDEMGKAGRGAANARGFALQARRVAALMKDRFNLAFLDVGGWDTHVNQGAADGQLANRIGDLGAGLAAYAQEMGADWNRTTVIVLSEFGRTFHENGNRGTDHGHGSVYWVLGGAVQGGRMAGPQVQLSQQTLNQGRDLPVLTDYRGLIGGVVSRLYGMRADRLDRVFPGAAPVDLNLV